MTKKTWCDDRINYLRELIEQGLNNEEITKAINKRLFAKHSVKAITQKKSLLFRPKVKAPTFKERLEQEPFYNDFLVYARSGRGSVELIKWLNIRGVEATVNQVTYFIKSSRFSKSNNAKVDKQDVSEKYNIIHSYFKDRAIVQVRNLTEPFRSQTIDAPADLNKAVREMEGLGMLKRLNDKQVSFR